MMGGEAQLGLPPMGNDRHTNIYRSMQSQMYQSDHDRMMQQTAQADWPTVDNMTRNFYRGAGKESEYTKEAQDRLKSTFDSVAGMAGMVDNPMAIRAVDILTGGRSALPMAHYLHSAGRLLNDPKTGQRGISAESAGEMATTLRNDLFGKPGDMSQTTGLSSAESGEMIQELIYSGRMATGNPNFRNATRTSAAEDVKRTITSYSRVLATMKEIFIENGQLNPTMRELLETADAMTGGMQQISTKEAETKLRTMQASAQRNGLSMQAVAQNLQATTAITQGLGMNQQFANDISQAGFDYREGLLNNQFNQTSEWGRGTPEQLQMQMQQQTGRFAMSEGANRLGMLSRIAERKYGNDASKITGNTATDRAMRAIIAGKFDDEDLQTLMETGAGAFNAEVSQSTGMRTDQVMTELEMVTRNEEQLYKEKLVERAAQATQFREFNKAVWGVGGLADSQTKQEVGAVTGGAKGSAGISTAMTAASGEVLASMDNSTRADSKKRYEAMAKAMRDKLESATGEEKEAAQAYMAAHGDKLDEELRILAEQQYGIAEARARKTNLIRDSSATPEGYLTNFYATLGKEAQEGGANARGRNAVDAFINSRLAGTVDHNILSRLGTAMQDSTKEGATLSGVLKNTLGISVSGSQEKQLIASFTAMKEARDAIEKAQKEAGPDGVSPELEASLQQLKEEREKFNSFLNADPQKELKQALEKQTAAEAAGISGDGQDAEFTGTLNAQHITINVPDGKFEGTNAKSSPTQSRRGS